MSVTMYDAKTKTSIAYTYLDVASNSSTTVVYTNSDVPQITSLTSSGITIKHNGGTAGSTNTFTVCQIVVFGGAV